MTGRFAAPVTELPPLRAAVAHRARLEEAVAVAGLLPRAELPPQAAREVLQRARELARAAQQHQARQGGLDAFLHEYDLSSEEGVVMMCLAEALLRIPDRATADRLIKEKLARGQWDRHLGAGRSLFVNASTWALMLTGRLSRPAPDSASVQAVLGRVLARGGEPLVRVALQQAMRILARQFVLGRDMAEALQRGARRPDTRYSYDMLGEAALTATDVERYMRAYQEAIARAGEGAPPAAADDPLAMPGVSVKLSALHPRYAYAQHGRVLAELGPRLQSLAQLARAKGVQLTWDAEEAERLDLSLDLFEQAYADPALAGWEGLGLAVQAYQKRAPAVLEWLAALARGAGRRMPVRLVKGAYWDSEIKWAQERGLDGFPVYTRKLATDVSWLACARLLVEAEDAFHPQFATHNAYSVAYVLNIASGRRVEFQRLHGMGEALYEALTEQRPDAPPCRIYAPVGGHRELLPYLVRRLLENGANTSFVHRLGEAARPIEQVVVDPVHELVTTPYRPSARLAAPPDLFRPERKNSRGLDFGDVRTVSALAAELAPWAEHRWRAAPIVGGRAREGAAKARVEPCDHSRPVGDVVQADAALIEEALALAQGAARDFEQVSAERRARWLEQAADALEAHRAELMALCVREAGKTLPDALAEVREAADFCRYYAAQARRRFQSPQPLPGPAGESNFLQLHGRGVFLCISPWNFPLAIFVGQVAAALAAGNPVLAKPASHTPLVAARAVEIMLAAEFPAEALQFVPAPGAALEALVCDPRLAGIAFTGSTEVARGLQQRLAARPGPLVPLIAETGGQNAMIVDSSALPEQVVTDVLHSAFNSAGQRCSALRVLCVQQEIAPRVLELLKGAMAELRVGDPALFATDVGPVIDAGAAQTLAGHVQAMRAAGLAVHSLPLPEAARAGSYFAPTLVELDGLERLHTEVFGPVLHVLAYAAERLDDLVEAINATGYGLTLGIHSRIDATVDYIRRRARVGNVYVNRNMIGAVVGAQPFGGEGLSGTGPKAGGPHYLLRFATERTVSVNTAAVGGNASLLAQDDD
ncbi:bifunctional proline dehydrogenase/L-glutamate gamma-semialdehyde dehydrogenase PutA [Ectothiorhodospiraceae bacterium 2226]|nr:bifunctional proline dehydrogenase/L-glutamate gamma-semialdehyde dehydrogenase PutA [Ectothiorhodospiraceae bacterium 2226]